MLKTYAKYQIVGYTGYTKKEISSWIQKGNAIHLTLPNSKNQVLILSLFTLREFEVFYEHVPE